MFPVTAETTVSVSERAHLPSNMFSIPQAERCAARLRKRPPTEQMAEPWNTGDCERLRKSLGWSPWQEQQEGAVGGILDKLHFTETSNKHRKSGSAFLSFSSIYLPASLPSISLLPFPSSLFFLLLCLPPSLPPFCPPFLFPSHALFFSLPPTLRLLPSVLSNELPQAATHTHHQLEGLEGGCLGPIANRPLVAPLSCWPIVLASKGASWDRSCFPQERRLQTASHPSSVEVIFHRTASSKSYHHPDTAWHLQMSLDRVRHHPYRGSTDFFAQHRH